MIKITIEMNGHSVSEEIEPHKIVGLALEYVTLQTMVGNAIGGDSPIVNLIREGMIACATKVMNQIMFNLPKG